MQFILEGYVNIYLYECFELRSKNRVQYGNTNLLSNSTLFAKCLYIHFNYKL